MKKLQVLCLCVLLSIGVIGCTGADRGEDGTEKIVATESVGSESEAKAESTESNAEAESDIGVEEINVEDPFEEEQ